MAVLMFSLCDKRLVERLGLKGKEKPLQITNVNKQTEMTGMEVDFTVASLDGGEHIQMERVLTIDRLPVSLRSIPKQSELKPWNHLHDIQLPEAKEDEVMLLIGSDVPEAFWSYDERRGQRKGAICSKTSVGMDINWTSKSARQ